MTAQLREQQDKLLHTLFHTTNWTAKLQKIEHYLRGLTKAKASLPLEIPKLMRRVAGHPEHQGSVDAAITTYEALPGFIFKAEVMLELYRELAGMTDEERAKFFGVVAGHTRAVLGGASLAGTEGLT